MALFMALFMALLAAAGALTGHFAMALLAAAGSAEEHLRCDFVVRERRELHVLLPGRKGVGALQAHMSY